MLGFRSTRTSRRTVEGHEHPKGDVVWITDDIAVSPAPRNEDWPDLLDQGIKAVVEIQERAFDDLVTLAGLGIAHLCLEVPEGDSPSIDELDEATAWIQERIEARARVLIHCRAGRGRSSLVACAALVRLGFSGATAYSLVRRNHPGMELSDSQAAVLEEFTRSRILTMDLKEGT